MLFVYAQPNGKKTEILGKYGERLKVRIHAPPVDGKANQELIEFFSELFQLKKSEVTLLRGETSREKTFLLKGISLAQAKILI